MWLANPHPILQGGPLFSMAKAVFIPPAELVVFLRLSTQSESPAEFKNLPGSLQMPGQDFNRQESAALHRKQTGAHRWPAGCTYRGQPGTFPSILPE